MRPIYLDNSASTPVLPAVWEAMLPFLAETFANPASSHSAGRAARRALEDAREKTAALLGAAADEVIFTSGATEANNLAIFGVVHNSAHILTSPIEHPCVLEPLRQLEEQGCTVDMLPVNRRGVVEAAAVRERLRPNTELVAVMLANHETGAVQPIRDIAGMLPASTALHCDAAAAAGKLAISFHDLGVATLTISAHKFHGPKGVGALLVRRGRRLQPRMWGGHQQQGRRPGTEPVALAAGLSKALELAVAEREQRVARVHALRERFLAALFSLAAPVVINGSADGLPHTLNVSFPGCKADVLLMNLDLAGVACSTGSACSSGSLLPSPVLRAMQVSDDVLHSAMRFSFSHLLEFDEVDEAAKRIAAAAQRLRTCDDPD
jgi:cysteine desulfurase